MSEIIKLKKPLLNSLYGMYSQNAIQKDTRDEYQWVISIDIFNELMDIGYIPYCRPYKLFGIEVRPETYTYGIVELHKIVVKGIVQ